MGRRPRLRSAAPRDSHSPHGTRLDLLSIFVHFARLHDSCALILALVVETGPDRLVRDLTHRIAGIHAHRMHDGHFQRPAPDKSTIPDAGVPMVTKLRLESASTTDSRPARGSTVSPIPVLAAASAVATHQSIALVGLIAFTGLRKGIADGRPLNGCWKANYGYPPGIGDSYL